MIAHRQTPFHEKGVVLSVDEMSAAFLQTNAALHRCEETAVAEPHHGQQAREQ
jgi:hypothetical protein